MTGRSEEKTSVESASGFPDRALAVATQPATSRNPVVFLSTTGGTTLGDHDYHYRADCPFLRVELFAGASLRVGIAPPPDALDGSEAVRLIAEVGAQYAGPQMERLRDYPNVDAEGRYLCAVCRLCAPCPAPNIADARGDDCAKCGCSRWMHESELRYLFAEGCAMAWTDAFYGPDGEVLQVGLVHCRCDGYDLGPPPRTRRPPPDIPPY